MRFKLKQTTRFDKVLQELNDGFDMLMYTYLQKLHDAFHEDYGLKYSHADMVNKIKQKCMSIFSNKLETIAFDDRSEEEVIREILEYNYDMADIKYMQEVEQLNLYPIVNQLNENCVKRTDPEWFSFGVHELLQNGKVDLGPRGSKRIQFCKWCGEGIYISSDHRSKHSSSKKGIA